MRPSFGGIPLLLLGLCAPVAPAQVTSSLRGDWSDTANPNGVWAYRQGDAALNTGTWNSDFTPQLAWTGTFPTVWLRAQSTVSFDVQIGDVVTHTANSANVRWTSPGDGVVDVAGGAWMLRDIGRSNDWSLLKNGVPLSSGSLFSGDPYDRAHPFDLDAGSGGALEAIPVSVGDQFDFYLVQTSASGDYVGVDLTYSLTPVPEPGGILVVLALVGATAGGLRRPGGRLLRWWRCGGRVHSGHGRHDV